MSQLLELLFSLSVCGKYRCDLYSSIAAHFSKCPSCELALCDWKNGCSLLSSANSPCSAMALATLRSEANDNRSYTRTALECTADTVGLSNKRSHPGTESFC
ncbi:Uncharacterised protein [Chlamydia abortus]|nr:Uncharacterised protein [Chlamydia abortus]